MRFPASVLSQLAAGLALGLSLASAPLAEGRFDPLADAVAGVEARLGACVGVALVDAGSDLAWRHRADERFLMNSTAKVPICAAVLARRDAGALSLADRIPVREADLLSYAPVAGEKVGEEMSLAKLCLAALDLSDNTAANLALDRIGGPSAVTRFFRETGDEVSRLDRREPELNRFAPGDPRDTTTPAAMAQTLDRLLLGDALSHASRAQLAEWMSHGGVTGALIRAEALEGWRILDKSGSGSHTRNLVAVVEPEGRAPWIVALFVSDVAADFATRNAALQEIGRAAMAAIRG